MRSSVGGGCASSAVTRVSDHLERMFERRPVRDLRLAVSEDDSNVVRYVLLY